MRIPGKINAPAVLKTTEMLAKVFSVTGILRDMAKTYLFLKGDRALCWRKDSGQADIVGSLEEEINRIIKNMTDNYQGKEGNDNILDFDVEHCYDPHGYRLVVRMWISYYCIFSFDYLPDVKDTNPELYELLRLVGNVLCNDLFIRINDVEIYKDGLYESYGDDEATICEELGIESIDNLNEEVRYFKDNIKNPIKYKKLRSKLDRIKHLRKTFDPVFTNEQIAWIDNAIELFDICADKKLTAKMHGVLIKTPDNESEYENDPTAVPDDFFFITMRYGTLTELYIHNLESMGQSGYMNPHIEMTIEDAGDTDGLIGLARYFNLLGLLSCNGGNEWHIK